MMHMPPLPAQNNPHPYLNPGQHPLISIRGHDKQYMNKVYDTLSPRTPPCLNLIDFA